MKKHAIKCACGAPAVVTNVRTWAQQCWSCCAGPDMPMLRRVEIETDDGNQEVVYVHAVNNREAIVKLWAGRRDIESMLVAPLTN